MVGVSWIFFFFNDTATTEIYTLSLHDALPICEPLERRLRVIDQHHEPIDDLREDRKSTRLNSSHSQISYAVFCLKKKKNMCLSPTNSQPTSLVSIPMPLTSSCRCTDSSTQRND